LVFSNRITFGGLASGIDTNMIIDQMLAMQQRPIIQAENRRAVVQQRMQALGSVGSQLSTLLTRLSSLQNAETFRARQASVQANTENQNKISVSASSAAATGSFSFHVTQLATSTKATSTAPMGTAIDAAVSLDQAGFGTAFKAGTFSINGTVFTIPEATASSIESAAALGAGFDPGVKLDQASLDIPVDPAGGTFEINGVSINWSAENDSLDQVITRINNAGAGVTASFDADAGTLRLVSDSDGDVTIDLADTTGNFLEAMKLVDGGGATIGTISAGEDIISLNDVITMVNNAGIGVTASLEDDAHGRPNLLQLTSASNIQLGSGGDTSNLLALTSLLQSPPGATRTSVQGLGALDLGGNLDEARMSTALTESSGSFTINGVSITYNAAVESLQNLISRINGSGAGVTASYDAHGDRLIITQNATGSSAIQLADVEGNFLDAFAVLGAEQAVGQNAAYQIDGGPVRYSTSNTISDAVTGITLVARDTTTQPVTIEVRQSTTNVVEAVDGFVKQFNAVLGTVRELTKYNEDGPNGVLFGDGSLRRIESTMRSILTRAVDGLPGGMRTLADVGISFGAVGSAVGSTNELRLNTQKLTQALQSEPEAVRQLFAAFTPGATLQDGGTGPIESIEGVPAHIQKAGRYEITSTEAGHLVATFIPNDGSAPIVRTGSIQPGGTNDTLIPGVTLTAAGTLVDGTNVIFVPAEREGIAKSLHEFVSSLTRSGGVLSTRNEEMQKRVQDINRQVTRMEDRLATREQQLIRQFAAMEQAFARMQSQQQALTMMQTQLQNLQPSRRR
jgi:flagellar hook-associated protein 2